MPDWSELTRELVPGYGRTCRTGEKKKRKTYFRRTRGHAAAVGTALGAFDALPRARETHRRPASRASAHAGSAGVRVC